MSDDMIYLRSCMLEPTHNLHMVALCVFRRVYIVPSGTFKDGNAELGS